MASASPVYAREGDEVLAFWEGRVIAKAKTFAKCEKTAVEYLDHLTKKGKMEKEAAERKEATHVETPNGLKGEILGNHEGQWGEREITVRWSNGRISKYQAHGGNDADLKYSRRLPDAPTSVLEYFESVLSSTPGGSKEELVNRVSSLTEMISKASHVIQSGVSELDANKIDGFVVAAEQERSEAKSALEYLEQADAESFSPPAPFVTSAVEQASLGGHDGSWLDATVNEMVREAESLDHDKLLLEGAPLFVTELDTAALADAGVTRDAAISFITAKTAGLQGDDVTKLREDFLDRVEYARKDELKDRKKQAKKNLTKSAKKEKKAGKKVPDDALFI